MSSVLPPTFNAVLRLREKFKDLFKLLELTRDTVVSRIEIPIRAPVSDDSIEGTFMRPHFIYIYI